MKNFIRTMAGTAERAGKKLSLLAFSLYHIFYIVSAIVDYFTKDKPLIDSMKTMTSELYPFWIVLAIGVGATGLIQKGSAQLASIFSARNNNGNNSVMNPIDPTTPEYLASVPPAGHDIPNTISTNEGP